MLNIVKNEHLKEKIKRYLQTQGLLLLVQDCWSTLWRVTRDKERIGVGGDFWSVFPC